MNLGLLVSGNLGLLIIEHLHEKYNISFVATDKRSEEIIQFCEQTNISIFVGNPRSGAITTFIDNKRIEVLLSVNYLFLIEQDLISLPSQYAINFHGSLLPKYRGRTPHVWAIINNESEVGITAHKIGVGCDTGDIALQEKILVENEDTGADILIKYNDSYPKLVDEILNQISKKTISFKAQEENKATYFGKRSPEDGLINWSWGKERIRNWIRAQAFPYPGAFSFCNSEKLIIDKASYTDHGYHYSMEDGLVLEVSPGLLIKVSNGVLHLTSVRNKELVNIKKGDILR